MHYSRKRDIRSRRAGAFKFSTARLFGLDQAGLTNGHCSRFYAERSVNIRKVIAMKIPELPFTVTNWDEVAATRHAGESGHALWKTVNIGDIRVRIVEYTPGYVADHWCDRGHIIYVIEGELISELKDGRISILTPGMSYQVSDFGDAAHRSSTKTGVKLFIVD